MSKTKGKRPKFAPISSVFRPKTDLYFINVYGAGEVRTIAVNIDLLIAFYLAAADRHGGGSIDDFDRGYNPWTRSAIFCATDGMLVIIPGTPGDFIFTHGYQREDWVPSDPTGYELVAFERSLPRSFDLGLEQMLKGNFIKLAQQDHEALSANKTFDWWTKKHEPIWVPGESKYVLIRMTTRLGIGIRMTGEVIQPDISRKPPRQVPVVLD